MQIDLDEINKRIEAGLVSVQRHPTLDLRIFNYTPRCQFERVWDEWTTQCRGLIVDGAGNVVARPFKKFYNADEHYPQNGIPSPLPPLPLHEPFDVYEKLDGSLGIVFLDADGKWSLATRGSFSSPQAKWGTETLRRKHGAVSFRTDLTYLFEIIDPRNRIVVNYGDRRDVVLLAVIETATGHELPIGYDPAVYSYDKWMRLGNNWAAPYQIGMSVARRFDGVSDFAAVKAMIADDQEGFVIRFRDSGVRVKIKGDEYKRLHRIITGTSARTVHRTVAVAAMKEAGCYNDHRIALACHMPPIDVGLTPTFDQLLDHVPDEFSDWVRKTVDGLRSAYETIDRRAKVTFIEVKGCLRAGATRRDHAVEIAKHLGLGPILFRLLDGRPYGDLIWKQLYPAHATPFHNEVDDDV